MCAVFDQFVVRVILFHWCTLLFTGATRTLETPDNTGLGSPGGSVQDVKEHSGSYQSSDSEFYWWHQILVHI